MLTLRSRHELPVWSIGSSMATALGLPPKDPDEDDEDTEDDESEGEGEEEPAVVREPDE